ncbi:MAG: TetR/AcrR family transcriptional regulator [Novosphingobium sp.]
MSTNPSSVRTLPSERVRLTQVERTALSDARMFEAAMHLIVERGTHNTTLKEVGEKAGYSRGLASNRFGSKEVLFGHLVRDFNEKWASELRRFVGGNGGLAALGGALDAVEFFLLNRTSQMQAMYILWFESITSYPLVRRRLAANHIAYRRDTARWISQGIANGEVDPGIDPESFAVEFSAFIFGLVYQWLASPPSINLHTVFQHYRNNTLHRLKA